MNLPKRNFKQRAHELVDQLPDTASWKDLAYEASVLHGLEEALGSSEVGQAVDPAIQAYNEFTEHSVYSEGIKRF